MIYIYIYIYIYICSGSTRSGCALVANCSTGNCLSSFDKRISSKRLAEDRGCRQNGFNTNGAAAKQRILTDWGKRYALALSGISK